jgi:predicted extracellular nuclease
MNLLTISRIVAAAGLLAVSVAPVQAQIRITEWMYNPLVTAGEFVEFTNMGATAINFSGWSFDDNSRTPGSQSLSAFGIVLAGQSVIFTESSEATFRSQWNVAATVKVIGGNTNNLARSDEINLYNSSNVLVDRLTYNDQDGAGPRTQGVSGRPVSVAAIGANNDGLWVLSVVGDIEHAYRSNGGTGDLGSPGFTSFAPAPVPEPETYAMLLAGLGVLGFAARRRKKQ